MFVAGQGAAAEPQPIGVYGLWGAFREGDRCYAIAQPVATNAPGTRPYAAVGFWPGRAVRGQFHLRLSREKRPDSAVLLRVDARTFSLAGRGWDAWTTGPAADADLLAALRSGLTLTVETRTAGGALVRDQYRLQGAPSAIDAAALACSGR